VEQLSNNEMCTGLFEFKSAAYKTTAAGGMGYALSRPTELLGLCLKTELKG